MNTTLDIILSLLLLAGGILVLIGSIGLVRLPDFYTRLHAPTKATTLGMGTLLIASMLYTLKTSGTMSVHELLITLFLFISAPLVAHLLAKSAMHERLPPHQQTSRAELIEPARDRKGPNQSDN